MVSSSQVASRITAVESSELPMLYSGDDDESSVDSESGEVGSSDEAVESV